MFRIETQRTPKIVYRLLVVFVNVANRGLGVFLTKKKTSEAHLFCYQEMNRLPTARANQKSCFCEIELSTDGDFTAGIDGESGFD